MKPIIAASLLVIYVPPAAPWSEEDVLTPDKIRASESAPELPDIQLGENLELRLRRLRRYSRCLTSSTMR